MSTEKLRLPSYGGQALIEGVLMRGSHYVAAAMRTPEGEIVVKTEKLSGIYNGKIVKIPFLRGLISLWDGLGLGLRLLTASANVQTGEDEKIEGPALFFTMLFSFAIAMVLFFLLPAASGRFIQNQLHWSQFAGNLLEGIIRLILVILYIWGIGKMSDIARVFGYHGAEHKTINTFEAGLDLTIANVKNSSREHPRCGTAFILDVVIFSVIIFSLLGSLSFGWLLLSRILLLPLIVMVAYEYLRWTANHLDSKIVRFIAFPGLKLQKLTTREPSDEMIEVAIKSFNTMITLENS